MTVEAHNPDNVLFRHWFAGYHGPVPPFGYRGAYGWDIYYYNKNMPAHGVGATFGFLDCHVEFLRLNMRNINGTFPRMNSYTPDGSNTWSCDR